jgi:hypothetical protein
VSDLSSALGELLQPGEPGAGQEFGRRGAVPSRTGLEGIAMKPSWNIATRPVPLHRERRAAWAVHCLRWLGFFAAVLVWVLLCAHVAPQPADEKPAPQSDDRGALFAQGARTGRRASHAASADSSRKAATGGASKRSQAAAMP